MWRRRSGPRSTRDVQNLAADEPGRLADEERHGVGDVLRLPGRLAGISAIAVVR
jgi:hypothetical protein